MNKRMRKILDRYPGYEQVRLMIGEGGVFTRPTIISTVLGSCVSVTFFCRRKKIGGIFHAILPVMPPKESRAVMQRHYRYVDTSIRHIIRSFLRRGIGPDEIEAKVFGGAQAVFKGNIQPGPNNIKTAFEVLAANNIKIIASDVGGDKGRNLIFVSDTGEVFVKGHLNNIHEIVKIRKKSSRSVRLPKVAD